MRLTTLISAQYTLPVQPNGVRFDRHSAIIQPVSGPMFKVSLKHFVWLSCTDASWTVCLLKKAESSGVSNLKYLKSRTQGLAEFIQKTSKTRFVVNKRHHRLYREG